MDGVTHELTLQDIEHDPNCITKSTCIVTSNVDRAIINAEAAKAFDKRNNGPEGRYPCQSFTGALWSLLAVGFELA